jgi:hypothetical protein
MAQRREGAESRRKEEVFPAPFSYHISPASSSSEPFVKVSLCALASLRLCVKFAQNLWVIGCGRGHVHDFLATVGKGS